MTTATQVEPVGYKDADEDSRATSWSLFTQNTTFHGIKYIFESSTFRVRRLLWVVCVLTAIGFFTYQVCSRSLTFFKYETNVDVNIVYADSVQFPAVTICNQNNFRLTNTVALNLYDFFDTVYSAQDLSELDTSGYDLDNLDTETVILETAHQRDDLIRQCTWNGMPCNVTEDFRIILTDLGVCYTFNSGWNSTYLYVQEPGPDFGLSLVLNLEQYEYMKGPQSDAGVKILLHDRDDTPLLKGRGFAVAPGSHTLVGIEQTTVRELEPPYGECSELASPMAVCVTECKTRQVVARCGCRHPYMANLTDVPFEVCNMTSAFICVQAATANLRLGASHCDCPVPCKRVTFEPSLSYAELSMYSIEKISLPTQIQRQQVRERFLTARETSQRWVKDIIKADQEQMGNVLNASSRLLEGLRLASSGMNSTATLAESYQVGDVLQNGMYAFYGDPGTTFVIDTWFDDWRRYVISLVYPIGYTLGDILRLMKATDQSSSLVARIARCTDDVSATTTPSSQGLPSDCGSIVEETQQFAEYWSWGLGNLFRTDFNGYVPATELKNYLDKYKEIHDNIFDGTPVDPMDFLEHRECLETVEQIVNTTAQPVEELLLLANQLTGLSNTREDLFATIAGLQNVIMSSPFLQSQDGWREIELKLWECNWVEKYSTKLYVPNSDEAEEAENTFVEFYYKTIGDNLVKHNDDFALMASTLDRIGQLYEDNIRLIIGYCQSYLNGNISKASLSQELSSLEIAMEEFMEEVDTFEMTALEFSTGVLSLSRDLQDAYDLLCRLPIPTFRDRDMMQSALWNDLLLPSPRLQDLLVTYTDDRASKIGAMLEQLFQPFVEYPAQTATQLNYMMADLSAQIRGLQKSLLVYTMGNEMDTKFYRSNFLQVDIFYNDITYEKVEQQIAFEFLSLVGEVGGFLGLLLGASVLTVCELVDYLVLLFVHRCQK